MIERRLVEGLEKIEGYYPTSEFDRDMKDQTDVTVKSVSDGKLKEWLPRVVVYGFDYNGEKKPVPVFLTSMPWSSAGRCEMFRAIGTSMTALTRGVLAVFFVAESWMVEAKTKDEKIDMSAMPSENPKRKEVIVLMGMTLDRRYNRCVIPISGRRKDGVLELGKPKLTFSASAEDVTSPSFEAFWSGYAETLFAGERERRKHVDKPGPGSR